MNFERTREKPLPDFFPENQRFFYFSGLSRGLEEKFQISPL